MIIDPLSKTNQRRLAAELHAGAGSAVPPAGDFKRNNRLNDLALIEELVGQLNEVIGRLRTDGVTVHFGGTPTASDPLAQKASIKIVYDIDCERAY